MDNALFLDCQGSSDPSHFRFDGNKYVGGKMKSVSKEKGIKKREYVYVRARRGEATDNHSLAERVRREKIGERMKLLQDLVPGCNHLSGKAAVLDEIINYVHSLQRHVQFLSMRLASVNSNMDSVNLDAFGHQASFCQDGDLQSIVQMYFPHNVSDSAQEPSALKILP